MSACMRNRLFRRILQTAVLTRERARFRDFDPENDQMVVKSRVNSALHGNAHTGFSSFPRPFREKRLANVQNVG